MTTEDLLVLARRLTAASRVRTDTEQETQTQGQIRTALTKIDAALQTLSQRLLVHRKLLEVGVEVGPLSELARPGLGLRDHVRDVGRPTPQFLNARLRELNQLLETAKEGHHRAWRTWAEATIDSLDESSIPTFGAEALRARERIKQLVSLAPKEPSVSTIIAFTLALDAARDSLRALTEHADAADLLTRIAAGGMTLADLRDEDLSELRADVESARRIALNLR